MKFLLVGDPHFTNANAAEIDILSDSVVKIINEGSLDFVVLLGDIMDKFENSHVIPWNRSNEFIERLGKLIPTIVLIGNHDLRSNKENKSGVHFFNALKGKHNIHIIDHIQEIRIKDRFFLACPFLPLDTFHEGLLKYFKEKGDEGNDEAKEQNDGKGDNVEGSDEAKEQNDEAKERSDEKDLEGDPEEELKPYLEKFTCVFGHQEINGCNYNGRVSASMDKWFPSFPPMFSGHI